MKKNILAVVFASAFGASFLANAAAITSGTPITTKDCPLLGEQVNLSTSNNVSGSYSCDEITSTIKVAACHKGGSRKAMDVKCAIVTEADGTTPAVWNNSSCKATTETYQSSNYRGFVATSKGGSVAQKDLGGACDGTTVEALLK